MLKNIPGELFQLLALTAFSIVLSIIYVTPVIIWRLVRRKPIIHKAEKLKSPNIFFIGVALFGGFGLFSFIYGMPYFGTAFFVFMIAYVIGLIAYRKGWRG